MRHILNQNHIYIGRNRNTGNQRHMENLILNDQNQILNAQNQISNETNQILNELNQISNEKNQISNEKNQISNEQNQISDEFVEDEGSEFGSKKKKSSDSSSSSDGGGYWRRQRKLYKANCKSKKTNYQSKEEYVQSELYQNLKHKRDQKKSWKEQGLQEIEFHLPKVVIDLSFSNLMTDKERRGTVSQLHHLYGDLRKSSHPLHVTFTGISEDLRAMMNHVGFDRWKVFSTEKSFTEEFDIEKIIYLSPDSPNVLTELDKEKIYIIGGIVDHNRLKNVTYKSATERNIQTARLPLVEYLKESIGNSLNPNHVFSILMDQARLNDWETVLSTHVPSRYITSKKPQKAPKQKQPTQPPPANLN
uniref:tRNA (guanine(9)-N(1))-methyltransferase n=1 Tax=Arcella intermedia TaxID=1963864 RepID=A0A6B2L7W6_9EUKA